jgi:hypothetical protein
VSGRHQDLSLFVVEICSWPGRITVGTGFIVDSIAGTVVTCSHVFLRAAGNVQSLEAARVGVVYHQLQGDNLRQARISSRVSHYDDDVLVLVVENPPAYPLVESAILGRAEPSTQRATLTMFKSFGYRRLESYQGLPATGEIVGFASKPVGKALLCAPLMLKSQHVDSGMSGAPVLDPARNLVIGLISQTWDSVGTADRDTAFAVDADVLARSSIGLTVRDDDLPLAPTTVPIVFSSSDVQVGTLRKLPPAQLPPPIDSWAGRQELLSKITRAWEGSGTSIIGLVGLGGVGKSALARKWLDEVTNDGRNKKPPVAVFWWSFYEHPNWDEFLQQAILYLGAGILNPEAMPLATVKA